MRMRRWREEHGFTMAPVVIAIALITSLVVVAAGAVQGDLRLTRYDLDHKQAYEAARAGLSDYAFHLNSDSNYWTRCTTVPEPERGQPGRLDHQAAPGARHQRRHLRDRADPAHRADLLQHRQPGRHHDRDRGAEHGDVPHPLDRLQPQRPAVDRRHLQARQLPRLPLLHPARDLGPGHLRQRGDDRRRQRAVHEDDPAGPLQRPDPRLGPFAVLQQDLLHRGRPRQRPPAHQRRAPGLQRHADLRPHLGRRDRGQRAAARLAQHGADRPLRYRGQPQLRRLVRHQRARADPAAHQQPARQPRAAGLQVHRSDTDQPRRRTRCRVNASRAISFPANGVVYVANGTCSGGLLAVHGPGDPGDLGLRQRHRPQHRLQQLHRAAHDRRRERHHHRRRSSALGQRHARPDRQQLRPRLPPVLHPDRFGQLRRRLERQPARRATCGSTPRCWRSSTPSSSTTTTAALRSET